MRIATEFISSMAAEGFRWEVTHGFHCGRVGYWLSGKDLEGVLKEDKQDIPRLLLLSTEGLGKHMYRDFYHHTDSWVNEVIRAALRARLLCTTEPK